MIQGSTSHITADTAIIGGGILGLWAARHAIRRGENVVLVDKRKLGSGASGGFLGALMPHMPDSWNIKKQLQYNGIKTLSKVTQELEEEVGLSCCFDRCGRIMPIPHEKLLTQVERRKTGAVENWDTQFELTQIDEMSVPKGWMNAEIAVHGIQYDTLSARISPRAYMRALEAYIRPRASIVEGVSVVGLNHGNNGVDIQLGNGEKISAGKAFVCNGWE
ncbi:MAG: FAD-binding oxidoreductase, partial [Pseudomonadota bacterium]